MAEFTGIEWTDKTFNGWIGCSKVSEGCKNCYAEADQDKRRGRAEWGVNGTRSVTTDSNWNEPLKWNAEAEKLGIRYKVFCSSLADVFEDWQGQVENHKKEPLEIQSIEGDGNSWVKMTLTHLRFRLWKLIEQTPFLDWQLLTKRIENVSRMVPAQWMLSGFPGNVWVGASMEDQPSYDKRVRELLKIPAAVRFISYEPALSEINTHGLLKDQGRKVIEADSQTREIFRGIQWVICGGESGPNARPMSPEWARSMRDQCRAQNVPFFFKQWGTVPKHEPLGTSDLYTYASKLIEAGYDASGKKGGATLDGKQYKNFPDIHTTVNGGEGCPKSAVTVKFFFVNGNAPTSGLLR